MDYAKVRRDIRLRCFIVSGVASIFMGIGAVIFLVGLAFAAAKPSALITGLLVGGIFGGIGYSNVRSAMTFKKERIALFEKLEKYTFDWYQATFPQNVRASKVTCRHCESGEIGARGILDQTYHREHFCRRCGETLYYSPECSL